ncbi:MAG: hypothetical protein NTV54_04220 [Ignavibacteriales bacterium]|nr:hypothetical protein [Ignavibacteriales bacterium]
MMKLLFPCSIVVALLLGSCGGKHENTAKITEANNLMTSGDFEKGIAVLDGLGKEAPADTAVLHARVAGYMKYATFLMYESPLPPKQKYSTALKMYRSAVKLDPTNKVAKENIATIEGIYQQMGRPIPD